MKLIKTASYLFALLFAACLFFGWTLFFEAGHPPSSIEYQKRLKDTATNISAAIKADGDDDF